MRTYGRLPPDPFTGYRQWVEVDTDAGGYDDRVWFTTLLQVLQLEPGESPFYANYGVPSQASVITQLFPDFFVARTQQQFAGRFATLTITKQPYVDPITGAPAPYYDVRALTHLGASLYVTAKVPT